MKAPNAQLVFWCFMSVFSSVCIIMANKFVMSQYGFNFVFSLSALHFLAQALALEISSMAGVFEKKYLPAKQNVVTALAGVASIVFMNFNLRFNSVGIYQISKLCTIPLMVLVQQKLYGTNFSSQIKFTLLVILLGVGITAVTDLSVNMVGLIFAAVAVVTTTQFQIWQGSKQKAFGLSSIQITHSVSFPMFVITGVAAMLLETGENSVFDHQFAGINEVAAIIVTCVLAISVNISSFTLIGISSPVTYQVVGHMKTILVLVGGMALFPIEQSTSQLLKNIVGIVVAMIGVILYGDVKQCETNSSPSMLERVIPRFAYKAMFGEKQPYIPLSTAA